MHTIYIYIYIYIYIIYIYNIYIHTHTYIENTIYLSIYTKHKEQMGRTNTKFRGSRKVCSGGKEEHTVVALRGFPCIDYIVFLKL